MARMFAYCRVSISEQTYENQLHEIKAAGFDIEPRRVFAETVSGSTAAMERDIFRRLLDKLDWDDVLVVTKLDRLGRNAMDVRATVERLAKMHVRVHCLALGSVNLTSAAGKMTMGMIAAVAEFERALLIERPQAGLSRAKAQGKKLGRPSSLTAEQQDLIRNGLACADKASRRPTRSSLPAGALGLTKPTHSLRRTKAPMIYKATGNLRAVQILLGHSKIDNTIRYLGVDIDDALALAERTEM